MEINVSPKFYMVTYQLNCKNIFYTPLQLYLTTKIRILFLEIFTGFFTNLSPSRVELHSYFCYHYLLNYITNLYPSFILIFTEPTKHDSILLSD